jgi:tRNA nucleotidyltransferase (CCA-adding enzyme)
MDSLLSTMEAQLPREVVALLHAAGELAQHEGQRLCLVGGVVRDLLLGRPNLDLDLVVQGDAPRFARLLAKASGEKPVMHSQFGTVKLHHGGLSIDVATARSETYPRPGALPVVTPATIEDDLARRDFSINAMAIDLGVTSFGQLLDPFGGRSDLAQRLVRILHDGSFVDDATRILRALRYEQRLRFRLEERTEELLRQHASMLDTISGDRIRHELELNLMEDYPERILRRAEELGVLQTIHPSLRGNGWLAQRFQHARQLGSPDPALYLMLVVYPLSHEELEEVAARLNVSAQVKRNMRQVQRLKQGLHALTEPDLPRSGIHRLLKAYSPAAVTTCALACDSPLARSRLKLYLDELRHVKPCLGGDDLKRLGLPPGPPLGRMLQALLRAKLDGKVNTRKEEEALVRQKLRHN